MTRLNKKHDLVLDLKHLNSTCCFCDSCAYSAKSYNDVESHRWEAWHSTVEYTAHKPGR